MFIVKQLSMLTVIFCLHISNAWASEKVFPYLLKKSEFAKMVPAEQIQYLNLILQVLSEAEQSKKLKSMCVIAGDVFSKEGNTCAKKDNCSKHEVPCAPYLAENECVLANSKDSPTSQCLALHPINKETAGFFSNPQSADMYRNFSKGLSDFCSLAPKPKSCQFLEEQTEVYRLQLKPKPKATSLFNLLHLLFTQAYAASPCSYDAQTQTFTGQDGQAIEFHFAKHGSPAAVADFNNEMYQGNLRDAAQKLVNRNSGNNESMRKHSLNVYNKLKSGELKWIGFEGTEKYKKYAGGTVGMMKNISSMEKDLIKSGLSGSDLTYALVDLYGSDVYGYYLWFKEQPNQKVASEQIKLIGVDNGRENNNQMQTFLKKSNKYEEQLIEALGDIDKADTPENRTFSTKLYDIIDNKSDAEKANLIQQLLNSPDAAAASPAMRKAAKKYLEAFRDNYENDAKKSAYLDKTMQVRDFSMAQDTFKALVANGQGLTTLGALHEKGTIEYLIQTCKNYRGGNSSSGSNSPSKSNSKPNSVNSAN